METKALFAAALGVAEPWYVADVQLVEAQLTITVDFRRGGRFACAECGTQECPAHDSQERRWRHLNFFEYRTEIVARLPRVRCAQCGVHAVTVPWARPGSGFTLAFEAFVLTLAAAMPMARIGRLVGEQDTRLWRLVRSHVDEARGARDDGDVTAVGIDETSSRRGHHYISLFVDLVARRLLFATPGREAETVHRFAADLTAHGGEPAQITEVCADMSPAYIKGVTTALPNAALTFDKFHLMQLLNAAVDETRRAERAVAPRLKGQRYTFLHNVEHLTDDQLGFLAAEMQRSRTLKTTRAFHLKLVFQDLFTQPRRAAAAYLTTWCRWAMRSRLPAMVKAARTIRAHWDGVLRWFTSRLNNGVLEGINSLVQAAKAKARGYRTIENLITIAYLLVGKLDFNVSHIK